MKSATSRLLRRLWREERGSDDVLFAILVAFLLALMFLSSGWLVMILLAVFFGRDD